MLLLAALAGTPGLVAAVAAGFTRWQPVADQAYELLRVAEVGGRHTPLVGAWSRWGWSHPGPWLFWVLAPFHGIGGPSGAMVGTALVAALSSFAAVLVAARKGGSRLAALVALAALGLTAAAGLGGLVDPWNPYVAMLPFLVVLVAAASAVDGDAPALVAVVVAGSWCVQAHSLYLVPVAAVAAPAAVMAVRSLRSASSRARWWVLGSSAAVAGLLWLPPLVDQVAGSGNLGKIARYAASRHGDVVGWAGAVRVANDQLAPYGPWSSAEQTGPLGFAATSGFPSLLLVLLLLAVVLVLRLRSRRPVGTVLVASIAVVASLVTTSRISGLLGDYLVRFWWPVAAIVAVALLDEVAAAVPRSLTVQLSKVGVASAALLAVLTVAVGLPLRPPLDPIGSALADVVGPTLRALDPEREVLVQETDLRNWGAVTPGMVLALESHHFDVKVRAGDDALLKYGSRRILRGNDGAQVVTVVGLDDLAAGSVPPGVEVARADRLSKSQRAESDRLLLESAAALGQPAGAPRPTLRTPAVRQRLLDGGMSASHVDRLVALDALGPSYAVFVDSGRRSP